MAALTTASTFRFELIASKDGATWDFSDASTVVTLYFQKPDGTNLTGKAATILSPATGGIAYYDSTTTDIIVPGNWVRSWQVSQLGIVQNSRPIPFLVVDVPQNES